MQSGVFSDCAMLRQRRPILALYSRIGTAELRTGARDSWKPEPGWSPTRHESWCP